VGWRSSRAQRSTCDARFPRRAPRRSLRPWRWTSRTSTPGLGEGRPVGVRAARQVDAEPLAGHRAAVLEPGVAHGRKPAPRRGSPAAGRPTRCWRRSCAPRADGARPPRPARSRAPPPPGSPRAAPAGPRHRGRPWARGRSAKERQTGGRRSFPIGASSSTTAKAAIPSPRPVKPMRSVVVALTLTRSGGQPRSAARISRMAGYRAASRGRWATRVRSALWTESPRLRLRPSPAAAGCGCRCPRRRVGVRKVTADVAEPGRPQQGVAQGVDATSPSEWAASPWSCSMCTPPSTSGRPGAKRWASIPCPISIGAPAARKIEARQGRSSGRVILMLSAWPSTSRGASPRSSTALASSVTSSRPPGAPRARRSRPRRNICGV
jgi:hypothetical protein